MRDVECQVSQNSLRKLAHFARLPAHPTSKCLPKTLKINRRTTTGKNNLVAVALLKKCDCLPLKSLLDRLPILRKELTKDLDSQQPLHRNRPSQKSARQTTQLSLSLSISPSASRPIWTEYTAISAIGRIMDKSCRSSAWLMLGTGCMKVASKMQHP